ncbi:MAG TPA: LytTR family DNA-binding domain-containing protein [Caulobacteraceae bacterium]
MADAAAADAPRSRELGRYVRIVLACLAVAVVIGISGRSLSQAAEWTGETLFGATVGVATGRWLVPQSWYCKERLWAAFLLIIAAIVVPLTGVVLACQVLLHGDALNGALVLSVTPQVAAVTTVMTALAFLVRNPLMETHAAPPGAPPPKFLARLPARLQGADLYAVEAEDHYLRLHTSAGQDLILMRLGDAVAELEGLEGAQTHRSWWVAKAAVASAERFEGRATLKLKDGAEVPVSRGFARALRQAGWF